MDVDHCCDYEPTLPRQCGGKRNHNEAFDDDDDGVAEPLSCEETATKRHCRRRDGTETTTQVERYVPIHVRSMTSGGVQTDEPVGIAYSYMSAEEIRRRSVVEIYEDKAFNGDRPVDHSVQDCLTGTSRRRDICMTCQGSSSGIEDRCGGHAGHIELALPEYDPNCVNLLLRVARCACIKCSALILDPKDTENPVVKRLLALPVKNRLREWMKASVEYAKNCRCGVRTYDESPDEVCGAIQPTWVSSNQRVFVKYAAVREHATEQQIKNARNAHAERCRGVLPDTPQAAEWCMPTAVDPQLVEFPASEMLKLLGGISDEDLVAIGAMKSFDGNDPIDRLFTPEMKRCFNARPENMIIQNLHVLPPSARPTYRPNEDSTMRSSNDLTTQYCKFIKENETLKQLLHEGAPPSKIEEQNKVSRQILYAIYGFETKNENTAGRGMRRPAKTKEEIAALACSLASRLKSKQGRLRMHLQGKRVWNAARSVVTCDPFISPDEVGVPEEVAKMLCIPEVVNDYNRKRLEIMVRNGPHVYPGALEIQVPSVLEGHPNVTFNLEQCRMGVHFQELKNGWIVNRHIDDGRYWDNNEFMMENPTKPGVQMRIHKEADRILFNRQPSLHLPSLMCHRVRVFRGIRAFRLNPDVTKPYNADFDGDEMNAHVLQGPMAQAEGRVLMAVPHFFFSAKNHMPLIGPIQDSCNTVMRLCDAWLTREEMLQALATVDFEIRDDNAPTSSDHPWCPMTAENFPPPAMLKPQQLWTGRQLISCLIPRICLYGAYRDGLARDRTKGAVCGTNKLRKDVDADPKLSQDILNHNVLHIDDGELLVGVLDSKNVSGLIMSVAVRDFDKQKVIVTLMDRLSRPCHWWMARHGASIGIADFVVSDELRAEIRQKVAEAGVKVSDILGRLSSNAVKKKQQTKLCQEILSSISASLSGVVVKDTQLFRDAMYTAIMSGAKGNMTNLVMTRGAVGLQRCENNWLEHGGEDRTLPHYERHNTEPVARGYVIHSYHEGLTPAETFVHGYGGRDGVVDTAVKTSMTGRTQRQLIKGQEGLRVREDGTVRDDAGVIQQTIYGMGDGLEAKSLENFDVFCVWFDNAQMHRQFGIYDATSGALLNADELRQLIHDRDRWFRPVLLRQNETGGDTGIKVAVNPIRVLNAGMSMFRQGLLHGDGQPIPLAQRRDFVRKLVANVKAAIRQRGNLYIFAAVCRVAYCALNLETVPHAVMQWVAKEIVRCYGHALVAPGEMVGIVSAQCIGEPATQMTLKTFHMAGVGSEHLTQGVPALNQLINLSDNKNSVVRNMTVYFKEPFNTQLSYCLAAAREMTWTTVEMLCRGSETEVVYEPVGTTPRHEQDWDIVALHEALHRPPPVEGPSTSASGRSVSHHVTHSQYSKATNSDAVFSPWVVRFVLDKAKCIARNITPERVAEMLFVEFGQRVQVVNSSSTDTHWVLRLRVLHEKSDVTLTPEQANDSYLRMHNMEYHRADRLATIVAQATVAGIKGVDIAWVANNRRMKTDPATGACHLVKEYIVQIVSTNIVFSKDLLHRIRKLDYIDAHNTRTNDVKEMARVYGVANGQRAIETGLARVMSISGIYVNPRHFHTTASAMSSRGELLSMTIKGVQDSTLSPMTQASFEKTVRMMTEAAADIVMHAITGPSDAITLGINPLAGTGTVTIMLDTVAQKEMEQSYASRQMQHRAMLEEAKASEQAVTVATDDAKNSTGVPGFMRRRIDQPRIRPRITLPQRRHFHPPPPPPPPRDQVLAFGRSAREHMHKALWHKNQFQTAPHHRAHQHHPAAAWNGGHHPCTLPPSQGDYLAPTFTPAEPYQPQAAAVYRPSSPTYDPTHPDMFYQPTSPTYQPSSPTYDPSHPDMSYRPSSPAYLPSSPAYQPSSPAVFEPQSQWPTYLPSSPAYKPHSPPYRPSSPAYNCDAPCANRGDAWKTSTQQMPWQAQTSSYTGRANTWTD